MRARMCVTETDTNPETDRAARLKWKPRAALGSCGFQKPSLHAGVDGAPGRQPAWRQHQPGSLLSPPPLPFPSFLLHQGSQREANPGKGSGDSDIGSQPRIQSELFGQKESCPPCSYWQHTLCWGFIHTHPCCPLYGLVRKVLLYP